MTPYNQAPLKCIAMQNLIAAGQAVQAYILRSTGKKLASSCTAFQGHPKSSELAGIRYLYILTSHSNRGLPCTVSETDRDFGRKLPIFSPADGITLGIW